MHTPPREAKRRVLFCGLPVNVEIEVGEEKAGTDEHGEDWAHVYQFPYGELAGTEGRDGDPVDVYLGPDEQAAQVYVVHQLHADGAPDEDKVFLGFPDPRAARAAYYAHGPAFGFGGMEILTFDEFQNGYLAATLPRGPELFDTRAARADTGQKRYGS